MRSARLTGQPWRRAASPSRASASTATASGSMPATSQRASPAPLSSKIPQVRSQRPLSSLRAIGPRMAKVTVRGVEAVIECMTRRPGETHRSGEQYGPARAVSIGDR